MNAARTLLASLIDYAGLFPPAELQMRAAVPRYGAYRRGPHAWLLNRFVLPLAQIDEFEHSFDDLPANEREQPWSLTVLGGRNLDADVRKIVDFNRRHGDDGRRDARIDSVELRVHSLDDVARAVDVCTEPSEVYFEIGVATDPEEWLAAVAGAGARAKVRTGGVSADMFPSVKDLARFIHLCSRHKVPFKSTAGLHHALRGEYSLGTTARAGRVTMHGFLNLFVAAALAWTDRVGLELLEQVLGEQTASAFAFDATGVNVRGRRISCEDLAVTRARFALSYGSCSVEEPAEDLKRLDLI